MDKTQPGYATFTRKQAEAMMARMTEVIESFDGDGMVITDPHLPDILARSIMLQLRSEGYIEVIA